MAKGPNAGNRNDARANGKAAKKNPGSRGSRRGEKLDPGFLMLMGKGPLTRKDSTYRGPSPANAQRRSDKPGPRSDDASA